MLDIGTGSGVIPNTLTLIARPLLVPEPDSAQSGARRSSAGAPVRQRKLAGKSQRELRDLGPLVEDGDTI